MTHTHTLMCSDGLQGDLRSSAAFGISQIVCVRVVAFSVCTHSVWLHVVCVCLCGVSTDISTPTFTIPQDLSESQSSPSYLISQQLTVCRYHTALQPAGSRMNPKLSGRLNHLFGSCWFRRNGVVQMLNFQWSTVLSLGCCMWKKKETTSLSPWSGIQFCVRGSDCAIPVICEWLTLQNQVSVHWIIQCWRGKH